MNNKIYKTAAAILFFASLITSQGNAQNTPQQAVYEDMVLQVKGIRETKLFNLVSERISTSRGLELSARCNSNELLLLRVNRNVIKDLSQVFNTLSPDNNLRVDYMKDLTADDVTQKCQDGVKGK